jgi:hypothetical protein
LDEVLRIVRRELYRLWDPLTLPSLPKGEREKDV